MNLVNIHKDNYIHHTTLLQPVDTLPKKIYQVSITAPNICKERKKLHQHANFSTCTLQIDQKYYQCF